MFSGLISARCLLPPVCLRLGLFGSVRAWKTDESGRQQQGAVTESCSQAERFLSGFGPCKMPQKRSYPPHDSSALQESHSGMLSNKVLWLTVMHVAVHPKTIMERNGTKTKSRPGVGKILGPGATFKFDRRGRPAPDTYMLNINIKRGLQC